MHGHAEDALYSTSSRNGSSRYLLIAEDTLDISKQ